MSPMGRLAMSWDADRAARSMAVVMSAALLALALAGSPASGQEPPAADASAAAAPAASAETADPRTMADVRARHGPPDAFAILYYDEPGPDGTPTTTSSARWSYFEAGLEFVFAGDEVLAQEPLELVPGSVAEPVPYDPGLFRAYMRLEELLEATGLEDYLGGPIDAIVEDGELYFADRLTWGLQDGQLRYVEALALEAEAARPEGD